MKRYILILFLSIFVFNCEGTVPLSDAEVIEENRAKIYLTIDENFDLKVKIENFESVTSLQFSVFSNDSNKFDITSYELGDYSTKIWTSLDEENLTNNKAQFIFGTLDGSGVLCTIKIKEPSSFDNISFHISEIQILNGNDFLYYSCSDSEYSSPVQCVGSGSAWSHNSDEFASRDVCYIKFYPTTQEALFDGDFGWSDKYCWPWQN